MYKGDTGAIEPFKSFESLRNKHLVHDENSYAQCLPGAIMHLLKRTHVMADIPVIALCLGPIAEAALRRVANSVFDVFRSRWLSQIVVGGILFVVVVFQVSYVGANTVINTKLGREL